MSRTNVFSWLTFAFFTICLAGVLMYWSVLKESHEFDFLAETLNSANLDKSCQKLAIDHPKESPKSLAEQLYKEAFSHNLNGHWSVATAASECAAYLMNGSHYWQLEAKNLLSLH